MHTVNFPVDKEAANKAGFIASALGVIFDPVNYDKSISVAAIEKIDDFFESLAMDGPWHSASKKRPEIAYGELFEALDTS